jgi:transcriptional regulator with XRE-family HTH domain
MSRAPKAFEELGPVLRDLRLERGLTQVELSDRAGVSKSMLSLYESGKQRPHLDTLERLLDALGIRLGELVMRLESWPGTEEVAPGRRGSRRYTPAGAVARRNLEEEAVAAATEVLQRIAALLQHALQGERQQGGGAPAGEPDRANDEA